MHRTAKTKKKVIPKSNGCSSWCLPWCLPRCPPRCPPWCPCWMSSSVLMCVCPPPRRSSRCRRPRRRRCRWMNDENTFAEKQNNSVFDSRVDSKQFTCWTKNWLFYCSGAASRHHAQLSAAFKIEWNLKTFCSWTHMDKIEQRRL